MREQAGAARQDGRQLVLGLGAVAMVAAAALSYAASLQRRRRPAYSRQEWVYALTEIGAIRSFDDIMDEIAERGIEPGLRPDVWPFLLEVFDHGSTFAQRAQQMQLMVRQYQQLLLQCQAYEAAFKESLRPCSPSGGNSGSGGSGGSGSSVAAAGQEQQSKSPKHQQQQQQQLLTAHAHQQQQQQQLPEQLHQFVEAHRIIVMDTVRTDFQKHAAAMAALQHQQQQEAYSWAYGGGGGGSGSGRASIDGSDGSGYVSGGVAAVASLVSQGLSSLQQCWLGSRLLGGQAAPWGHQQALWVSEAAQLVLESSREMPDESKRQACRMIAMLSAYALHDPDTGYCQGMSDFLLPLLLMVEDDALAFWCFVALMQRQGVRANFAVDESGIFRQLQGLGKVLEASDRPLTFRLHQLGAAECHFAYRMVVVKMRRDMPMHKVVLLWEVLWADAWRQRRAEQQAAAAAKAEAAADAGAAAAASGEEAEAAAAAAAKARGTAAAAAEAAEAAGPSPAPALLLHEAEAAEVPADGAAIVRAASGGHGKQLGGGSDGGGGGGSGSEALVAMQVVADSRGASGPGSGGRASSASTGGSWRREPGPGGGFAFGAGQPDLFTCFVAAVIISQRRTVLDRCSDADDVLRLFSGLRHVDVWQCVGKAQALRDALLLGAAAPRGGGGGGGGVARGTARRQDVV